MKALYLNNFRGFSETILELSQVNFFVGENSSGKTSILKVLRCLLNKEFWFSKDLDLEIGDLGYFNEICSIGSNSKTKFEIGIYFDLFHQGYKLTYIDRKGYPKIKKLEFFNSKIAIEINFESELKIKYRLYKIEDLNYSKSGIDFFSYWVKKNTFANYNTYESKIENTFLPIMYALSQIFEPIFSDKFPNLEMEDLFPIFTEDIFWSTPIRSHPRRVYDSTYLRHNPDGSHAPYLLRNLYNTGQSEKENEKKIKIERILSKFGIDSGLYEKIDLIPYDSDPSSPFRLQLKIYGKNINFTNVGYGVSQILPLVVEIALKEKETLFSLQQPEVHLHPKGQAAFGDFILKSCELENKKFVIETHSDYLIDRFRIKLNKSTSMRTKKITSQIVFFSKNMTGNKIDIINIDSEGRLSEKQPSEFRDFFIKEQLDLLNF